MRKFKVLKINPTTTAVGSIEIATNFTTMFQGRFYRNNAGLTQPGYTTNPSIGYVLIVATVFDIVENTKYAGRYTVYTPVSAADNLSSTFASGRTTIRVSEIVPPLIAGEAASLAFDGFVTNISTYIISTGGPDIVIPPGVVITSYPVELLGRNVSGWGEVYAQNYVNTARNFASATPPALPFIGMLYYDTDDGQLRTWNGISWGLVNQQSFGVTFRHTQSAASATWTVNHLLDLQAPFIAFVQFFVDRGDGPKLIIPSDVVFNTANQLTVTFSNPEIGYVLVRP